MRVILQGSVRYFAAAELMALLAQPVHTGTFDADSGEKRIRLFFQDGKIAWGEGTSGNDVQALVTDLVGWTDGNFTFLDAVSLPDGVTPLALDPIELAAEGARRNAEDQKVLALYPDEQTYLRVVPQPQTDVISLKPEQFQILFTIGTGRSLAHLLTALGRSALDLYPAVHALQTAGLIEVATAPEPVAQTPEPVAPPPPPALSQSRRSTDLCAILKTRPYRPESAPPLTVAYRDESRKTGFSDPSNSSNDQTTDVLARTSSRRSRPLQSSQAIRPLRSLRRERNPRCALPAPAV